MNGQNQAVEGAVVNGRRYSLWPKFVARKVEWIGGELEDVDAPGETTRITDIKFEPNGTESAMFTVDGEDWSCACDVRYLCMDPALTGAGWIGFSSPYGLAFRIRRKSPKKQPGLRPSSGRPSGRWPGVLHTLLTTRLHRSGSSR
jgi:hypothetical protein